MALHKERVPQEKAEKALYKKRNIQGTQMEEKYTQAPKRKKKLLQLYWRESCTQVILWSCSC